MALIHSPRQCGKTTLAQVVAGSKGYTYLNFDEEVLRSAVEADPAGFVADLPERAILDEVQRVPGLFRALSLVRSSLAGQPSAITSRCCSASFSSKRSRLGITIASAV